MELRPANLACNRFHNIRILGSLNMQARVFTLMLSGAIGMCVFGCAGATPTMRAQSPCDDMGSCHSGANHECPMCDSGFGDSGIPMSMACGPQCGTNCQPGCGINLPFHPVHRNFHTYDVPSNLTYPDASQPPATVQYPYYTHRGPTDFFMK